MLEHEFNALAAEGYNRIPLTLETFADLDTPLSIYLKLANEPYTYLLESVQGGERFGRYSFIGLSSPTRIEVYGRSALLLTGNRLVERRDYGDPLNFVAEFMNRIKVPPREHLPRFAGGLLLFLIAVEMLFDPESSFMQNFEEDSKRYKDAPGGAPDALDWLGGRAFSGALAWGSQFITPSVVRNITKTPRKTTVSCAQSAHSGSPQFCLASSPWFCSASSSLKGRPRKTTQTRCWKHTKRKRP